MLNFVSGIVIMLMLAGILGMPLAAFTMEKNQSEAPEPTA